MRRIKEILLGIVGMICALIMMELFIQGGHIVPPSFTDYVDEIGRVRRDNLDFVMFGEGFTINRFNEGRYLGPYYPKEKPQNAIRIAILGDSFVEGFQVFDRHHFRRILEEELGEKIKLPVQVLNFGRSGFDLEDMVAYDQILVRGYNPDLVFYFLSKDDYRSSVTDQLVPNLSASEDSLIIEVKASEQYLKSFIKYKNLPYYSTYINMISNCVKQHRQGLSREKLLGKFHRERIVLTGDAPLPGNNSIDESSLKRIGNILEVGNSLSNLIIIKRDTITLSPQLTDLININSLKVIDLTVPLKSLENSGFDPYYWNATKKHGHWNHEAHLEIGNYLAEETYELILRKR